jgi:hypothetical protein
MRHIPILIIFTDYKTDLNDAPLTVHYRLHYFAHRTNQSLLYFAVFLHYANFNINRVLSIYTAHKHISNTSCRKKSKTILLTSRGGPKDCETSRLLHFPNNRLTDGGEVVSLKRRTVTLYPLLPLILISVRGWLDPRAIVRLEGLRQLKNPTALSGIEPVTFRLVA